MSIPRAACNIAAIVTTAITIALLVVLPATSGSDSRQAGPQLASSAIATTPVLIER